MTDFDLPPEDGVPVMAAVKDKIRSFASRDVSDILKFLSYVDIIDLAIDQVVDITFQALGRKLDHEKLPPKDVMEAAKSSRDRMANMDLSLDVRDMPPWKTWAESAGANGVLTKRSGAGDVWFNPMFLTQVIGEGRKKIIDDIERHPQEMKELDEEQAMLDSKLSIVIWER